jgi:hypothetical protein
MKLKYAGAYIESKKHADLKKMAATRHRKFPDFLRLIFDGALDGSIEIPDYEKSASPARKGVRK